MSRNQADKDLKKLCSCRTSSKCKGLEAGTSLECSKTIKQGSRNTAASGGGDSRRGGEVTDQRGPREEFGFCSESNGRPLRDFNEGNDPSSFSDRSLCPLRGEQTRTVSWGTRGRESRRPLERRRHRSWWPGLRCWRNREKRRDSRPILERVSLHLLRLDSLISFLQHPGGGAPAGPARGGMSYNSEQAESASHSAAA